MSFGYTAHVLPVSGDGEAISPAQAIKLSIIADIFIAIIRYEAMFWDTMQDLLS